MDDELKFIRVIKVLLVIGAILAFAITCYQTRSSFFKGWKGGQQAEISGAAYHTAIFDALVVPAADSIKVDGNDGFSYRLKTAYLVSGDAFNSRSPQKKLSFLSGCRGSLTLAILVFGILLLLKLYYFIDDSSKGLIFTLENINRIKAIGGYCISLSVVSFLWDVVDFYITQELFSHTNFRTSYSFDFNYLLFVVGVVTIVIMLVFKRGYELKQEQDLTV